MLAVKYFHSHSACERNAIIILLHKNQMLAKFGTMIFSKTGNFILSLPAIHVGASLFQDP